MNTEKTENGKWKTENLMRKITVSLVLLFSTFHFPFSVRSQVRPVYDYGAIGLGQHLKKLNTTKSVMMIGAHPDDEDSALLAYLARGENARTAYLSLTRGDGGQNVIGAELFESLGVIRTEELLQARRLDGAEQFFTRAFDYGFSKTLTEAKENWDERIILCDAVRAIRMFRPLVVISRFSGTPADGHGQHQFAGYISPLAVKAAADVNQCADAGAPWQVLKFYVEQGFRSEAKPSLRINTGEYDFLLGRSYAEIAAEGRSQHKTQEQGGLELKGERFSGLNLIESKVPKTANEKSVFDGIDVSIAAIPKILGLPEDFAKEYLATIQNSAVKALREYNPNDSQKIIPYLIEGFKVANNAALSSTEADLMINNRKPLTLVGGAKYLAASLIFIRKVDEFSEAIRLASGVQIDALSNRETVAPNENFFTSVKVFYPENPNIKIKEIKLNAPKNWQISAGEEPKSDSPFARFFRETANDAKFFNVKVAPDTKLAEPYFLENERNGSLYSWNDNENQTEPFQKPILTAKIIAEIGGTEVTFNQPVEYRYADDVRGEIRRELNVVPKISLNLDQNLLIIPKSDKAQTRKIVLGVTNNSPTPISGTADLKLPDGWKVKQSFGVIQLNKKDESKSFAFDVTIPADAKIGNYEVQAVVKSGEEIYSQTMNTIAYPHIQTHRFYTDARAKVEVMDLKVAPVKVGYIMGSGDDVPEAIRQMNLPVDLLSENDLANGDLSKYDTIVVGIRAYNIRQDLISNNQKVLDYVKNGGTLIVQYQRPDYVSQNLQPFPASQTDTQRTTAGTTARVVDENAKVTILQPTHSAFNFPNKITDADFSGWVQERNLYNFTTFDQKYVPLLESHDAGELENSGGLVVAEIGKGKYVYTSYSFFRQLPAGVPGAYRLFANLLSLNKK